MGWLQASLVVYGLLNIALGALAYSKSPVSLYAGGGAGVIILICAWLMKVKPTLGAIIAAIVCIALLVRFGSKLAQDGFQLYPGFIIVLASAIMLILLIAGHFMAKPQTA